MRAPTNITGINWASPLARGLVAAFFLINGRRQAFYSARAQETLALDNSSGDITTGYNSNSGVMSTAFSGDGTNDRIEIGAVDSNHPISLAGSSEITVIASCRPNGSLNAYPRIIDKSTGSNGVGGWAIFWHNTGTDNIAFRSPGPYGLGFPLDLTTFRQNNRILGISVQDIPTSGLGTANGSLYVDGLLEATSSAYIGAIPATTANAAIGNWNHTTGRMFRGEIDYVLVFDQAIPAAQHRGLAARGSQWDIINQGYRLITVGTAAVDAGGGATVPIFAHHYNQMRAA